MPCSRMPKCSVRPYSSPGNALVAYSAGTNDGSPFIVVLLLSARSAEPPHSSGSTGASASSTLPEAARVAMPLASAGNSGSASVQPSRQRAGGQPVEQRLALAGWPRPRRRTPCCHSRVRRAAALDDLAGVREHLVVDRRRSASGSKPRIFLVAATSSAPSAEPWILPVFCLFGAGQPMIVRSAMNDGPVGLRLGRLDRRVQRLDVLVVVALVGVARAPVDGLHVPAVRLVAGADVLALGDPGVVLDGDLVVVVDQR